MLVPINRSTDRSLPSDLYSEHEQSCASFDPIDTFTPSAVHESLHEPLKAAAVFTSHPRGLTADRRLLTANVWDPIRVTPVCTESALVQEAQKHLGRPYRWGGNDVTHGVDCSGFTWSVYQRCGLHVPLAWFRNARVDARLCPQSLERDGMFCVKRPRPGDVVVFGRRHIGLYIGSLYGHAMYISANHGSRSRKGRVDIMPVCSVGIRAVYYRYAPSKMRSIKPARRAYTDRTLKSTSPPRTSDSREPAS